MSHFNNYITKVYENDYSTNVKLEKELYTTQETQASNYSIIVNLNSRRLSLLVNGTVKSSYPVAIGKAATPTPKGSFRIKNKALNPGGPFGARWLGITAPNGSYGIHGTNNPSSIGLAVSNGCIRMHNKDVIELYNIVPIGTIVTIY